MDDRIALSTITMTLHEPTRLVPSATISLEVAQLGPAADALRQTLGELDGRFVSGIISKRSNGGLGGDYQIEIPLANFDRILSAVANLGRVDQKQVRDQQSNADELPWASELMCKVTLAMVERSYQVPSGWIDLEVKDLTAALEHLEAALADTRSTIVSNQIIQQDDGSNAAKLNLRVRAGAFARLVDALKPLGRTTGSNVAGEVGPVVGGAADKLCDLHLTLAEPPRQVPGGNVTIEIADFEASREVLSKLVDEQDVQVLDAASDQRTDGTWNGSFRLGVKVSKIEAFLSGVESLGRVVSRQITGLGLGAFSKADPDAIGVIWLRLGEKNTIAPSPERAAGSIRARLRDALGGLYDSIGLIAYGFIILAPWLMLVVALAWVVTRLRRKRTAASQVAAP